MARDRIVHQFPPGEYTRTSLEHDPSQGDDPARSLAYLLVNRGMANAGVVLARMTWGDLVRLIDSLARELGRR